jgi:AraC family transcriptional regulator
MATTAEAPSRRESGSDGAPRASAAAPVGVTGSRGVEAMQVDVTRGASPARAELEAFDGWLILVGADGWRDAVSGRTLVVRADAPSTSVVRPDRALLVKVSRAALDRVAEQLDASPVESLPMPGSISIEDGTLTRLADLLRPALAAGAHVESPFVEHVLGAFAAHVAIVHGGLVPGSRPPRGGLATWQLRRAQDVLRSNLDAPVRVEAVAEACRLSVSHFSRAFRRSTGRAPGTWLREQRIEAAKSLLRAPSRSLSEVAAACGFADQSHLCRVFQRHVGVSPGAWRRCAIQAGP